MIGKLTIDEVIFSVGERWREQYERDFDRPRFTDPKTTPRDVYEKILKATSAEEIDAAIGNDSWTSLMCSECGEKVDSVAVFDVNCGEYSLHLCKSCCMEAWK